MVANPDFCRETITIYCLQTAHLWLWTLWTLHLSSQVSSLTSQVSQVRAFAADFFRPVLQARADFFWCLLRPANRQKNESGTKESKAHGPYRSRAGKSGEPKKMLRFMACSSKGSKSPYIRDCHPSFKLGIHQAKQCAEILRVETLKIFHTFSYFPVFDHFQMGHLMQNTSD